MTNKEKQEADQDQYMDDWVRGEHGERERAKKNREIVHRYEENVLSSIKKSLKI